MLTRVAVALAASMAVLSVLPARADATPSSDLSVRDEWASYRIDFRGHFVYQASVAGQINGDDAALLVARMGPSCYVSNVSFSIRFSPRPGEQDLMTGWTSDIIRARVDAGPLRSLSYRLTHKADSTTAVLEIALDDAPGRGFLADLYSGGKVARIEIDLDDKRVYGRFSLRGTREALVDSATRCLSEQAPDARWFDEPAPKPAKPKPFGSEEAGF